MCGCATHPGAATRPETTQAPEGLSLRVEDMTCGHCAATVKGEIESYLPGATAEVDLASKVVTVRGVPDLAAIEVVVASAGYTSSRLRSD
jgi:copper chaperone